MKSLVSYVIGCLFCIFAFSCDKPPITEPDKDCEEIVSDSPFGFYIYTYPDYRYLGPCFNPNNANEFLYGRINSTTGETALYKYDMTTDSSTLLVSNAWLYAEWGKLDWLLLDLDEDIWKVKSNGDSLTLLSDIGIYSDYVTCNADGSEFIFRLHYGDSVQSVISDLEGNQIIKEGDVFYEKGAWYPNPEKIIYITDYDNYGIAWIDTNLSESHLFKNITMIDGDDVVKGVAWLNDLENVLWTSANTASITNIYSGATLELIENCDAQKYINPSISPDGTKILFEKELQTKVSEVELYIENKIVIMNIDGSGEEVLLE